MSQTDLNAANASGAAFRADLNAHLDALATQNSGATAPSPSFPNQWWMDISTNILKQRDNANTTWVNVASKPTTDWIPYRNGIQTGDASVQTIGVATAANVPNVEDVQQSLYAAVLATGTADVITLSFTPTIISLNTFQPFTFEAASNNTGSVTINVDGLGAITAKKNSGVDDLVADDLVAGGIYTGLYDGTVIQIIAGLAGSVTQATQAAIEVEADENTYIPPDLIKHSPGVAKVWAKFDSAGTIPSGGSQNVDSIIDTGIGDWTVVITNDFSSADYAPLSMRLAGGAGMVTCDAQVAGSYTVRSWDDGGSSQDQAQDATALFTVAFGDQ